jgi:hypothetical protein
MADFISETRRICKIETHANSASVFLIPFFILKALKLRQRQKYGLIGVFSLGLITMAISFARFMIYSVSDYDLSDNDGGNLATLLSSLNVVLTLLQPSCVQQNCAPP